MRGGKVRLLLAEDSERLQELLSESLKQAGYMLDVVATAAELFSSVAAVQSDDPVIDAASRRNDQNRHRHACRSQLADGAEAVAIRQTEIGGFCDYRTTTAH